MSLGARVSSIDALRSFKASLQVFIDQVDKSLCECDIELQRVSDWVAHGQPGFWAAELKKRHDQVIAAQDELRRVQFTVSDQKPSGVEQKKAVRQAQAREEEARHKLDQCRAWRLRIEQAGHEYKGQVQHIASAAESDLPRACALLDRSIDALHAYVAVAAPMADESVTNEPTATSMGMTATPGDGVDPFDGFPIGICKAVRQLTPNSEERAILLAELIPLDLESAPDSVGRFLAGRESPQAIRFRDQVAMPRTKPGRDELLVIEADGLVSDRLFLERSHVDSAGDSGWYLGGLEPREHGEAPSRIKMTVRQLLAVRPEFREVISLPHGHLAIIEHDALVRLLDPHDESIWPIPSNSSPTQEDFEQ